MQGGSIWIFDAAGSQIFQEEEERAGRMNGDDYDYFYYPMKGKIVTNTLLNCLADTSVYVNRFALDYIITHMPIHSRINTLEINVTLVEAVLYLATKKDFACLKKFSTWLLSHLDDEDPDTISVEQLREDQSIKSIIPAL